jgi:glycosyltransferase involved in cell wall biosynthesis
VSHDVAAFSAARGGLPVSKIRVIPNGVDVTAFADAARADLSHFGIPRGARTLLFVGRLDPQKDPFVLLAATKDLLRQHSDLHLLLVGDGPLGEPLRAWVAKENLAERIHFAGRRNDVPSILRASEIFILPSLWEGLPNVVLEAMAAGVPVVATRVEGIGDLLIDDRTGRVVPPESSDALGEAISHLLADPEQAHRLAHNAQVFVRDNFAWNEIVENYEKLYGELLDPPARPA